MAGATSTAPRYRMHGCTISSELALDLPAAAPALPADVNVTVGPVDWQPAFDRSGRAYLEEPGRARLAWRAVGRALVTPNRVLLEREPGANPADVQLFLLGPVAAALFRQRGQLAFHASAVAGPAGAVGFLGWCGWGKSTTAAGLYARGWQAIADDLLVVSPDLDPPMAQPGTPHFRLDGRACSLLELAPPSVDRPPAQGKRRLRVEAGLAEHPVPLRLLLLLNGEQDRPSRLPLLDAWTELTRHTYTIRALDPELQAVHLARVAGLAQHVPIVSVKVPRGDAAFPWVERVLADFGITSPAEQLRALGA